MNSLYATILLKYMMIIVIVLFFLMKTLCVKIYSFHIRIKIFIYDVYS